VVRVCRMVCENLKHIGTTYVSAYYFIRVRIPLEVQAERLQAAGVSWETADEFAQLARECIAVREDEARVPVPHEFVNASVLHSNRRHPGAHLRPTIH
jgi:hypothetical protein